MKSKKELKGISEDALRKLLSTLSRNLNDEDTKSLCFELAASCFTYGLDFSLDLDELTQNTWEDLKEFNLMVLDGVINCKKNMPEGANYYDNTKS